MSYDRIVEAHRRRVLALVEAQYPLSAHKPHCSASLQHVADAVLDEHALLVSGQQCVVRRVQHTCAALQLQRQESLLLEIVDVGDVLLEQDLAEPLRLRTRVFARPIEDKTLLVLYRRVHSVSDERQMRLGREKWHRHYLQEQVRVVVVSEQHDLVHGLDQQAL